jgi:hypothetical protein
MRLPDSRFCPAGGVHLLYWQSIQDAKNCGLQYFDLGRTDNGQDGLVTFKNRRGATHSTFHYLRYASALNAAHLFDLSAGSWKSRLAKAALSHIHPRVLAMIGNVMYKHGITARFGMAPLCLRRPRELPTVFSC